MGGTANGAAVAGSGQEGTPVQPTARPPPMDSSLEHSFDSQVLGLSSSLPSPPSEPLDIRNWFSSYEYESPDPSELAIDLGRLEGESTSFEKIQEPFLGVYAVCRQKRSHFQYPESATNSANLDVLPIHKVITHGNPACFNDERLVREENLDQIQTQKGECPSNVDFTATEENQRPLSGSGSFPIPERVYGNREFLLQPNIRTKFLPHEQPKGLTNAEKSRWKEDLVGRESESSQISKVESCSEISAEEYCPRMELLDTDGCREQTHHATASNSMVTRLGGNSNEKTGGGLPGSWVSARGRRCPSDEGDENPRDRNPCPKKSKERLLRKRHDPVAARTALSDKTNSLSESTEVQMEPCDVVGKWKCPRRNKPERGPPLKQLRLECWVRRVP